MDQLKHHIKGSRQQYDKDKLSEENLLESPFDLFTQWLQLAVDFEINKDNYMIALASTIGYHAETKVKVECTSIEEQFTEDEKLQYNQLVPESLGGVASKIRFKEALDMS